MEYKVPNMIKFKCGNCGRDKEFPMLSDGTTHNKVICCGITYIRTDSKGRELK